MSRFFKALLILATVISCSPKEATQKVTYNQIEFQIPADWKYEVEELEKGVAYQINSTDSLEMNLFTIGWIEAEIDPQMYADIMKQAIIEESGGAIYEFSSTKEEKFLGEDALTSDLNVKSGVYEATGKIYSFKKSGKSYFILIQGQNHLFELKKDAKIISSLKVI